MDNYEHFHRNIDKNVPTAVKGLFNLNMSFVYRLIKAKNAILEIRAKGRVDREDGEASSSNSMGLK